MKHNKSFMAGAFLGSVVGAIYALCKTKKGKKLKEELLKNYNFENALDAVTHSKVAKKITAKVKKAVGIKGSTSHKVKKTVKKGVKKAKVHTARKKAHKAH